VPLRGWLARGTRGVRGAAAFDAAVCERAVHRAVASASPRTDRSEYDLRTLRTNTCQLTLRSVLPRCVRQVISEHIETDVRVRLGIAPADQEWREEQCPREWFPEKYVL